MFEYGLASGLVEQLILQEDGCLSCRQVSVQMCVTCVLKPKSSPIADHEMAKTNVSRCILASHIVRGKAMTSGVGLTVRILIGHPYGPAVYVYSSQHNLRRDDVSRQDLLHNIWGLISIYCCGPFLLINLFCCQNGRCFCHFTPVCLLVRSFQNKNWVEQAIDRQLHCMPMQALCLLRVQPNPFTFVFSLYLLCMLDMHLLAMSGRHSRCLSRE